MMPYAFTEIAIEQQEKLIVSLSLHFQNPSLMIPCTHLYSKIIQSLDFKEMLPYQTILPLFL